MIRAALLVTTLLTGLPAVARAQTIDACKVFTVALAREVAGTPMKQTRSAPGMPTGLCEFKDATGKIIVGFALWRLPSPDAASTSMRAMMTQVADAIGGTLEPVPGIGDEAMYLDKTASIYVRKGSAWCVFGHPNRKVQVIEAARKVAGQI